MQEYHILIFPESNGTQPWDLNSQDDEKCLCALVKELPRLGSAEGLLSKPHGSGGQLLHPPWGLSVIVTAPRLVQSPHCGTPKESVKVLCLVQPSCHRGGAAGPHGGQELSRVTLCVESESWTRCPVPRPAVCPWPHAACDKCITASSRVDSVLGPP